MLYKNGRCLKFFFCVCYTDNKDNNTLKEGVLMFRYTPFIFKITYYITSMTPAIMLFTLKVLYQDFSNKDYGHDLVIVTVLAMLAIVSLMAIGLLSSIKKKYRAGHYYSQNRYDTRTFSNENIAAVNGDPVSFLISNITSVFLIQGEIIPSILAYIAINLIIFMMMMNTFNIHPNIFFIVAGIDIVKTKENQFLINLNIGDKDSSTIQRFTEEEKGRLHVVGHLDEE